MKLSQRQTIILGVVILVVVVVGYLITTNLRSKNEAQPVTLTVWGAGESPALFEVISNQYKALRPNVTLTYVDMGVSGYASKVTDALASGQGPDVLVLGNRALPKEIAKLAPAPASQIIPSQIEDLFPRVVTQDFVSGGNVYALPRSIDTLALFYNKDMFDSAGITAPPKTWAEFQAIIPTLREINENRQLVRSAGALGGTEKTVPHAVDLVHLLMLQSGVELFNTERNTAGFDSDAGVSAMNYYLQFGDAASSVYTWNENQPSAYDSFLAGKTAMVFGYLKDFRTLKQKSPFLPIGIASVPQSSGGTAVSYADYTGLAVSKQSKVPEWAWDFVTFATTDEGAVSAYATAMRQVPALRTLIDKTKGNSELGVFARQALTARSWYEPDAERIDTLFNNALTRVIRGEIDTRQALRQAKDAVDQMGRGR